MWNQKSKTNKKTTIKTKQTHIQRTDWWLPEGRWLGTRRRDPVIKPVSHGDKNDSIRNVVSSAVLTLYGDRW